MGKEDIRFVGRVGKFSKHLSFGKPWTMIWSSIRIKPKMYLCILMNFIKCHIVLCITLNGIFL
jgi:hypothetical protein